LVTVFGSDAPADSVSVGFRAQTAAAPALSVAPTKGPGGTTITVHGAGCPQEGWGHFTWTVHVQIGSNGSALALAR
jgi:hypothetical protein